MDEDQINERKKRLLLKSEERLGRITGQPQPSNLSSKPLLRQESNEKITESESDSQSGDSTALMPAVPQPPKKPLGDGEFFRDLLTWIHTLMLIVLGVFSHAAFHQSCDSSCFSILQAASTARGCKDHFTLGRLFFYGGLFSIEIPFLFLTIKSYKGIGPSVIVRIFSGICLYVTSNIAASLAYQILIKS
jgi:hypothetical protein